MSPVRDVNIARAACNRTCSRAPTWVGGVGGEPWGGNRTQMIPPSTPRHLPLRAGRGNSATPPLFLPTASNHQPRAGGNKHASPPPHPPETRTTRGWRRADQQHHPLHNLLVNWRSSKVVKAKSLGGISQFFPISLCTCAALLVGSDPIDPPPACCRGTSSDWPLVCSHGLDNDLSLSLKCERVSLTDQCVQPLRFHR